MSNACFLLLDNDKLLDPVAVECIQTKIQAALEEFLYCQYPYQQPLRFGRILLRIMSLRRSDYKDALKGVLTLSGNMESAIQGECSAHQNKHRDQGTGLPLQASSHSPLNGRSNIPFELYHQALREHFERSLYASHTT